MVSFTEPLKCEFTVALPALFKTPITYPSRTGYGVQETKMCVLLDFLLTVKASTLIFISGCGLAISSAKEGKSCFIYTLAKS